MVSKIIQPLENWACFFPGFPRWTRLILIICLRLGLGAAGAASLLSGAGKGDAALAVVPTHLRPRPCVKKSKSSLRQTLDNTSVIWNEISSQNHLADDGFGRRRRVAARLAMDGKELSALHFTRWKGRRSSLRQPRLDGLRFCHCFMEIYTCLTYMQIFSYKNAPRKLRLISYIQIPPTHQIFQQMLLQSVNKNSPRPPF